MVTLFGKYSESDRTFFLTSLASDGDSGALTGVPLAESISRLKLDCMDNWEPLAMVGIRDRPPTDAPETDESRRGPISPFCWTLKSRHVNLVLLLQIFGDMTFYSIFTLCITKCVGFFFSLFFSLAHEYTISMDNILYYFRLTYSMKINKPSFQKKVQST